MEKQSLESLALESQTRLNPTTPTQAKRGRPPGTTKTTTTTTQPTLNKSVQPGDRPSSLGLTNTFKFLYEFAGKALAGSTKCPAYELDKNESETLGKQSDDLMTEFFPNIQSRWIKLVVFIGSLVGIFGKKYLDHLEQIKKESPQKIPTEGSNGSSPAPSETTVLSLGQTVPINPAKRF